MEIYFPQNKNPNDIYLIFDREVPLFQFLFYLFIYSRFFLLILFKIMLFCKTFIQQMSQMVFHIVCFHKPPRSLINNPLQFSVSLKIKCIYLYICFKLRSCSHCKISFIYQLMSAVRLSLIYHVPIIYNLNYWISISKNIINFKLN